jgi:hypothetical protein
MWRSIEQLVGKLCGTRMARGAEPLRSARLGMETLESRTVLSANFGVDFETLAYRDFAASPAPRILINHEASLAAAFAQGAASAFAEDRQAMEQSDNATFLLFFEIHSGLRPMDSRPLSGKSPFGAAGGGNWNAVFAETQSPEDRVSGSSGSSNSGPLKSQSQIPALLEPGPSGNRPDGMASSFDPPQLPDLARLLEQIVQSRHAPASPFIAPINMTAAAEETESVDAASLLESYATLAASIDNDSSSASSHDAAFDAYALARGDAENRDECLRLLTEVQTRDAAAEAGGYVELDDVSVAGDESRSSFLVETQREAIERALRSLAERRGDAQAPQLPEDWLQQAWQDADAAQTGDASANQIANEPGGMILLQPAPDAGAEAIAAGNMSEIVQTAVEMEATIGAFQAFDVSVDEASAAVVKPAPTHELGAKQDRDESSNEGVVDRQAASGLGVLAVGAMALAAKRQMDDRRRKPK